MIFINAFKSITRSKGRNLLIGIIVLMIAIAASVALAIQNAAEVARESALDVQSITGTITVDRQKMMEGVQGGAAGSSTDDARELMQQYSGLSLAEMQEYADSDYVEGFYYTATSSLSAGGELEPFSTTDTTGVSEETQGSQGFAGNIRGGDFGDFSVIGYSADHAMTGFMSGESTITDGALFDFATEEMTCLISNELAVFNDLAVGGEITLINPNNEEQTYSFTIAGIYTNNASANTDGQLQFSTAMDPANAIYVSYNTLNSLAKESEQDAVVSVNDFGMETSSALTLQTTGTYEFSSKEAYDSFDSELRDKGLSDYYVLSSPDLTSYEAALIPLDNLSNFAMTLLVIILIVGAVVLIVLNIFNIRERKYEVGVLTAIGIKKYKVAAQFVVELLAVTLTAIVIGTAIGAAISIPVSNNLLASQIESQEVTQSSQEQNFGRPGNFDTDRTQGGFGGFTFGGASSDVEYVDTINATINVDILLQLIGVGIVLTIISSLAGVVFVLRYDPLKILANRT